MPGFFLVVIRYQEGGSRKGIGNFRKQSDVNSDVSLSRQEPDLSLVAG
jgi:hypothetical protein